MINPYLLYLIPIVTPTLTPSPPAPLAAPSSSQVFFCAFPALETKPEEVASQKKKRARDNASTFNTEKVERLNNAIAKIIEKVENGEVNCVSGVAKAYGIPYNTLRDNYLRKTGIKSITESKQHKKTYAQPAMREDEDEDE